MPTTEPTTDLSSVNKDELTKSVREAASTVAGVVDFPQSALWGFVHDPGGIHVEVSRGSVAVRVAVGVRYPADFIQLADDIRVAVKTRIEDQEKVSVRRVDVTFSHLEFSGGAA